MNPIQAVLRSKIRSLVEMSAAAGQLSHGASIGDVRESLLTNFIRDLLPQGVSANSGILVDWRGHTSPQMDLVLTLDSSLPVITMREGVALIPVDSALLCIEIKSTLNSAALGQLTKQNQSIAAAKLSDEVCSELPFIIPTMIVALEDSDLSADTASSWLLKNGNTVACAVVSVSAQRIPLMSA